MYKPLKLASIKCNAPFTRYYIHTEIVYEHSVAAAVQWFGENPRVKKCNSGYIRDENKS